MTSLSARRLIPACILSAATVAASWRLASRALLGNSVRNARARTSRARASSLQKLAQQTVWDPDFNTTGAVPCVQRNAGHESKADRNVHIDGQRRGP